MRLFRKNTGSPDKDMGQSGFAVTGTKFTGDMKNRKPRGMTQERKRTVWTLAICIAIFILALLAGAG